MTPALLYILPTIFFLAAIGAGAWLRHRRAFAAIGWTLTLSAILGVGFWLTIQQRSGADGMTALPFVALLFLFLGPLVCGFLLGVAWVWLRNRRRGK